MDGNRYANQISEADLGTLADQWLADIRSKRPDESEAGDAVVSMNFSASPETQWRFILKAVELSESDDELSHVAAGPIEHLLGWHGEQYIALVESEVLLNPKFARALTGVWQYRMSDDVWSRLQTLQSAVADPLRPS